MIGSGDPETIKIFMIFLIVIGFLCVKFHYVSIYYPDTKMILLVILIIIWMWSIVQASKYLEEL
ncbi:hypothetical protein DN393_00125 [Bacillus sp. BPN334]|nr:hypothetical protein DN393_00125 [Bacillus sp. BPN334]